MDKKELDRDQLKAIVKETILKEMETGEGLMNRMSAAWDAGKDKLMGLGSSVSGAWKKEKAFDLYKKYRALFVKANQMKANVDKKAKAAFTGSNNAYATAKQFALSEEDITRLNKVIKETITDENFWSGLKNVGRNFRQSMHNGNSVADKFHNMQRDYHQGDAAGDALSYSKLFGDVNRAKAEFVAYCKQNGFDPKAIAQEYKSSVRQGVVGGQDKSRVGANVATNYGKEKFKGAGPSAEVINQNRRKLSNQRANANKSEIWENEEQLRNIVAESVRRVLREQIDNCLSLEEVKHLVTLLKRKPLQDMWNPVDCGFCKVQRVEANNMSGRCSLLNRNDDGTDDLYKEEINGITLVQIGRKPNTHWLEDSGYTYMAWKD